MGDGLGTKAGSAERATSPATLVVGDMHLKQRLILPLVDRAIERLGAARVVFCGDYCDEWGTSDDDLLDALEFQVSWAKRQRAAGIKTDFLLGNHDWCYTEAQPAHYTRIRVLAEAAELLEALDTTIAATVGGMLVTHAGLTASWALKANVAASNAEEAAEALNAMSELSLGMRLLYACGPARGGCEYPGPLWADRSELVTGALSGIPQIVGHTPGTCVEFERSARGDALAFVDTFSMTSTGCAVGDGSLLVVRPGTDGPSLTTVTPEDLGCDPWPALLAKR